MLKQNKRFILLFVVALLISLVLTMPMKHAYKWGFISDDIVLKGISGTVFKGKAKQLIANDEVVYNITWSLNALSLFLGRLSFDWVVDDVDIQGQGSSFVTLLGMFNVNNASLTVDSERFNHLIPTGNSVKGDIDVDIESASFKEKLEYIVATATLHSFIITSVVGEFNLDAVNIEVIGSGDEGFKLHLADIESNQDFMLDADIQENKVNLSGRAHQKARLTKELAPLLPFIGTKQDDNWIVSWQGILPI